MADSIISQFERAYALPIETYRQVADTAARDAIPAGVRWEGMIVYCILEAQSYELRGGTANGDWQVFGGAIGDAPNDGNEYVRKNNAWALASSGIIDAPIDGTTYGRRNGAWVAVLQETDPINWGDIAGTLANQTDLQNALDAKVNDAPADGNQYARFNNSWAIVSAGSGTLEGLTDTTITTPALDQLLRYTGTTWENWTPDFADAIHTHVAADITDFDAEVSNNTDVAANTAKVSFPGFTSLLADYGFTDNSLNWDAAYNDKINSASFDTGTGILTLTQQDAGTVTVDLDGRYLTTESDNQTLTWTDATNTLAISGGNSVILTGFADASHTHTASEITDFDTEVSNNSSVVANTAKVSFPGFTSLLADYGFTDNSTNWNTAYNDKINSASFNTGTGVLTLTQQDATAITVDLDGRYLTSETDNQTLSWNAVTNNLSISGGNSILLSSFANNITVGGATVSSGNINNWSTAFSWGDHAAVGYIEGLTAGFGLSSTGGLSPTLSWDPWSITDKTTVALGTDEIIIRDNNAGGATRRKTFNEIGLSIFLNDAGFVTEDNYADSLAFATGTGILTLGRTGALADLTVDLDGRYLDQSTADGLYVSSVDDSTGTYFGGNNLQFNGSGTNRDYVFFDDGTNTYYFNADTGTDTAGNATINAGTANLSTVDATGTIRGQVLIGDGDGDNLRIYGGGTGTANTGYLSIWESNGTTRQAYFGFGSNGNSILYTVNDALNSSTRLDADFTFLSGGSEIARFDSSLGPSLTITGASPRVRFVETGQTADWTMLQDGGVLTFRRDNTSNTRLTIGPNQGEIYAGGTAAERVFSGYYTAFSANSGGSWNTTTGAFTPNQSGGVSYNLNSGTNWNGVLPGSFGAIWTFTGDADGRNFAFFRQNDQTNENALWLGKTSGAGAWSFAKIMHEDGTYNISSNTLSADNFILTSDARLKTNIEDYRPFPVKARWRTFVKDGRPSLGVVAQELEKTNPEFVSTTKDDYKAVNYVELCIAKIAELEHEIKILKQNARS